MKCELYNDSMQGWKCYPIQKAQLIIADVPYNVGTNFYGSNPMWYKGGDNKNGESKLAGKAAFTSDFNFNLYEYFHFCSRLMKKEPKKSNGRGRSSDAPCMIVFCSFQQTSTLIQAAKKHGFINYIPLYFIKNYSPQVLKANMRIVGATEHAILFYRDKLPKFRNGLQIDPETGKNIRGTGHMIFDWFQWERDGKEIPKIHPAQKPVNLLKRLIEIFTDENDVVIDPCFGSGTTARAALELNRNFYGFEINKEFYRRAKEEMIAPVLEKKNELKKGNQMELDNKKFVINALMKTKREGIEDLIAYMDDNGFFTAPCSGGNHLACEFGLVHHTRNVMEYAEKLGVAWLGGSGYNKIQNSVIISAALHDLGKMGQFEKPFYVENVLASGKQSDTKPYKQNPELLKIPHEVRSVAIAQMFIDLTEEEQHAILYHNGLYGDFKYEITGNETPLYLIIHFADMWASRVIEK